MSTPFTPSNGGNQIITPGSGGDSFSTGSDISRVLPRQLSTGSTRGTQTVGYGNVQIDGSNNRITLGDTLGNDMTIGTFSNSSNGTSISQGFGLSIVDSDNSFITLGINSANKSAEMIFNDSRTNRLLIGKNYLGDEVVWISPVGVDVTSANPNQPGQLIFNSNQNIFKIFKTATVTIPGTGNQSPFANGAQGLIVGHSLGFIPAFLCYAFVPIVPSSGQPPVTAWNQLTPAVGSDSNQMTYNIQAGTDINNLYLVNYWGNNAGTVPVQAIQVTYYLYGASINS